MKGVKGLKGSSLRSRLWSKPQASRSRGKLKGTAVEQVGVWRDCIESVCGVGVLRKCTERVY